MDSGVKSIAVWASVIILLAGVYLGAGIVLNDTGVVETEPSLSTDMDCTTGETCVFDITVDSTGGADAIVVEYEPVEAYSPTVIELEDGESADFESDSTVITYMRHSGVLELHSMYRPMESLPPVDSDEETETQRNPMAGVTFDQSEIGADGEANVTATLISMEAVDTITVKAAGSQQTLTDVGEEATFTVDTGTKITVIGEYEGTEAVIQTYTVG